MRTQGKRSDVKKLAYCICALVVLLQAIHAWSAPGAQVVLTWDPPTQNSDGSPLTNLVGYSVQFGPASGEYLSTLEIGPTNSVTVANLHPQTRYFFAVRALNRQGESSDFSDELMWVYDGDADEMSDIWEDAHLPTGNPADSAPDGDEDGDGASNLGEFVAGTDPLDPSSSAAINILPTPSGDHITVSFHAPAASGTGYSGLTRHYALEVCTDLASAVWIAVEPYTDILAADQIVQYSVPLTEDVCYYRTRIWLE